MRSFVIAVPNKSFDGSAARGECKQRADVEAFVVDGAKEALDFAIGLRRVGPEHVMPNAERGADLLKSRQPLSMMRVAHGERERVVRQDRFDAIRQRGDDVLEEGGRRGAGLVRLNRDDGLAAEVIDGRKFEVMPGISQRRQVFEVDVEQLARSLFS